MEELVSISGTEFNKGFLVYMDENPLIFQLFERFANEAKSSGQKTYSHWRIVKRVRWERDVVMKDRASFKIDSKYARDMARLLILKDRSFEGFFRLRGR